MTATQRVISRHKTNLFLCQRPTILYKDVHSLGMLTFCKNVLLCLHLRPAASGAAGGTEGSHVHSLCWYSPYPACSRVRLCKGCPPNRAPREEREDALKARWTSSYSVWHSWNSECALNHASHTHQTHVWLIRSSSGKHTRAGLSPPLIYELFEGRFGLLFIFVFHALAMYSTRSSQISGTDRLKINMPSWTFISCGSSLQ